MASSLNKTGLAMRQSTLIFRPIPIFDETLALNLRHFMHCCGRQREMVSTVHRVERSDEFVAVFKVGPEICAVSRLGTFFRFLGCLSKFYSANVYVVGSTSFGRSFC
ncbi:unnamed protein product [Ectocarpus sp. 6 AP-2014]